MEMEMIVALSRRIHVSIVFAWKIPPEFRIVIIPISLSNTKAQHDPITQAYVCIYIYSIYILYPGME
jgi:hypothetical protein